MKRLPVALILAAALTSPTPAIATVVRSGPVRPHPLTAAAPRIAAAARRSADLAAKRRAVPRRVWSRTFVSVFGGPGEVQNVAGPYPSTGVMNARGPYYFAHRSLPFGTRVVFSRGSRSVVAVCADRGPAPRTGHTFDLGSNTAHELGLSDNDEAWVEYRIEEGR